MINNETICENIMELKIILGQNRCQVCTDQGKSFSETHGLYLVIEFLVRRLWVFCTNSPADNGQYPQILKTISVWTQDNIGVLKLWENTEYNRITGLSSTTRVYLVNYSLCI
jgi:hypothetical protein